MLKAGLVGMIVLALPAGVFGAAEFGRTAVVLPVVFALLAVGFGSGLFWLAKHLVRPKPRNAVLWSALVGLVAGFLTCFAAYVVGANCWEVLRLHGDLEAYLWWAAISSVAYGLAAMPFGWGLWQSGWRVR